MKRKERVFLGTVLLIVMLTLTFTLLYPAMSTSRRGHHKNKFTNRGSIKSATVGVYSDQACTIPVSSINWGILDPGSTANKTVYLRNEGNIPANLSITVSNWNPTSSSLYMALSWDYTGQTLDVNQTVQVVFTLSISANMPGVTDFSFDMTITAN